MRRGKMKKKIVGIFVCMLLITTAFPISSGIVIYDKIENEVNNQFVTTGDVDWWPIFKNDDEQDRQEYPMTDIIPNKPLFVPGELLVNFKNSITLNTANPSHLTSTPSLRSIEALNQKFQVVSVEKIFEDTEIPELENCYIFQFSNQTNILRAASYYTNNPYVEYAEPNYLYYSCGIPDDPFFYTQWALHNTGQTGGIPDADIDAPEAWELEQGDPSIIIAVIDSGVDYTNPDSGNYTVTEEEYLLESPHPIGEPAFETILSFPECDAVSFHISRFNVSLFPTFTIRNPLLSRILPKTVFTSFLYNGTGANVWSKYSEYRSTNEIKIRAAGPEEWGFAIDKIKKLTWQPLSKISPLYVDGYDFYFKNPDPMDDNGHGTHCAGIIAAVTNNTHGIAGIVPNCKIMPIKIFDPNIGITTMRRLIRSIIFAVNHGADIISMSLGGQHSRTGNIVLNYASTKDVVLIAAAGNENKNNKKFSFPAGYEKVIAVAATDANDTKAVFSDYGSWVDVAAPGVDIVSLRAHGTDMYLLDTTKPPGSQFVPPYDDNATLYKASGTSMACPHVAGVAGLILSKNPDLTPMQVRTILRSSTDKISATSHVGTGRINAHTALVKTAPVIAHLDPSIDDKKIKTTLEIKGIAQGEEFNHYDVEYAYGVYPNNDSWILLASSTVPKEGVLTTLDPQSLLEGQYTIRLQLQAGDHVYEDTAVIVVDNYPNTFYVDDNNTTGPWFGTQDHPFTHIQTAIDSCGIRFDKVVVKPGVYLESLNIGDDKSVQIHGEDKTTTIICGSGENSIGLSMFHSKFNTFDGFTLSNSFAGISMNMAHFNKVFNNNIIDNNGPGIIITYTLGNMFFDNTFINNPDNVFGFNNLNLWYNPARFRGNFWDDYSTRYPDASPRPLLSWSWDTPYMTSTIWRDLPFQPPFFRFLCHNDRFPLINPP